MKSLFSNSIFIFLLLAPFPVWSLEIPDELGGTTTQFIKNSKSFAQPLANLSKENLEDFFFGNKIFNTNWVAAPASVKSLDGLGPLYNRVSCSGCHVRDGRGRPPEKMGDPLLSILMRLSIPGKDKNGGPLAVPIYGGQLNDRSVLPVKPEGTFIILYDEIKGTYPDGQEYSLRKPTYQIQNLHYGKLPENVLMSPRTAPAVHGLGLIEAIDKKDILANIDPNDHDKDGVSGRINMVYSTSQKRKIMGRFGWKANKATLKDQAAGAALGDIGLATSLHPKENCHLGPEICLKVKSGGLPELSDKFLEKMVLYIQTLAVPARRHSDNPIVKKGQDLFFKAKCQSCHTPYFKTGYTHPVKELRNQKIYPFTDLLLHDMGSGLADHRPDFDANGNEWRTAPLWGIGLIPTVNKHHFYLHDGRARNIEEAILWHGGEAEKSKDIFKSFSRQDRQAMIAFIKSL